MLRGLVQNAHERPAILNIWNKVLHFVVSELKGNYLHPQNHFQIEVEKTELYCPLVNPYGLSPK